MTLFRNSKCTILWSSSTTNPLSMNSRESRLTFCQRYWMVPSRSNWSTEALSIISVLLLFIRNAITLLTPWHWFGLSLVRPSEGLPNTLGMWWPTYDSVKLASTPSYFHWIWRRRWCPIMKTTSFTAIRVLDRALEMTIFIL